MAKEIEKRFCLVYNTFRDMIEDPDIISDMVVMTLGYETVDDGKGGIYKIIYKGTNNTKNLQGESFGQNSPYYAKLIGMHDVESLEYKIERINTLLKGLETAINTAVTPTAITEQNIKREIQDTISASNKPYHVFYLDKEAEIKIVQTFDGLRYITHKNKNLAYFKKEIEITEENFWLIPTEFVISDFSVDQKSIHCGNIYYQNNTLTFDLDFTDPRPLVIPY